MVLFHTSEENPHVQPQEKSVSNVGKWVILENIACRSNDNKHAHHVPINNSEIIERKFVVCQNTSKTTLMKNLFTLSWQQRKHHIYNNCHRIDNYNHVPINNSEIIERKFVVCQNTSKATLMKNLFTLSWQQRKHHIYNN